MYYFNGLVDVFVIDSLECHDIVDIDTVHLNVSCYVTLHLFRSTLFTLEWLCSLDSGCKSHTCLRFSIMYSVFC